LTDFCRAAVAFSSNKGEPPGSDKKEMTLGVNAKFNKLKKDIAAENEVSVSVTWTGGGQHLKNGKCETPFFKSTMSSFDIGCSRTRLGL
jgi:hypothetical protein